MHVVAVTRNASLVVALSTMVRGVTATQVRDFDELDIAGLPLDAVVLLDTSQSVFDAWYVRQQGGHQQLVVLAENEDEALPDDRVVSIRKPLSLDDLRDVLETLGPGLRGERPEEALEREVQEPRSLLQRAGLFRSARGGEGPPAAPEVAPAAAHPEPVVTATDDPRVEAATDVEEARAGEVPGGESLFGAENGAEVGAVGVPAPTVDDGPGAAEVTTPDVEPPPEPAPEPTPEPPRFSPYEEIPPERRISLSPPAAPAAPQPAPAPFVARGERRRRAPGARFGARRRRTEAPPAAPALDLLSRIAAATRAVRDLNTLLDEIPPLGVVTTMAEVAAVEIAEHVRADVAVVLLTGDLRDGSFTVAGGHGLTRAERKVRVPDDHPLVTRLVQDPQPLLITPIELAGPLTAGLPGARGEGLLVAGVWLGDGLIGLCLAAGSGFVEPTLAAFTAVVAESQSGLALGWSLRELDHSRLSQFTRPDEGEELA